MPIPLAIDKQVFAALVLQGFTAVQVANKLNMNVGTARSWVNRMGLVATKSRVKAELAKSGKQDLAVQIAEDASSRVRKCIGSAVERDLKCLADAPASRTALQVKQRYAAIEPAIRIAEKVYGWADDQRGPSHVTLNQLNVSQPAPTQGQGQIIDVSGDKSPD